MITDKIDDKNKKMPVVYHMYFKIAADSKLPILL